MRNITTLEELKEVVQGNPKVIVKAGLSYCAPCKQVQPTFERVAEVLTDYVCVHVVADEVEGSAKQKACHCLLDLRMQSKSVE